MFKPRGEVEDTPPDARDAWYTGNEGAGLDYQYHRWAGYTVCVVASTHHRHSKDTHCSDSHSTHLTHALMTCTQWLTASSQLALAFLPAVLSAHRVLNPDS